jgi:hypothetical protein
MKRSIKRDYLLLSKHIRNCYIPQVGDSIYYFFQGHEKFISQYNCYFYCGDKEEISLSLYPWAGLPSLR